MPSDSISYSKCDIRLVGREDVKWVELKDLQIIIDNREIARKKHRPAGALKSPAGPVLMV
jgi:hypothetical protein